MPYKSDSLKINNDKLDKRVKILKSQHNEVNALYKNLSSLRKVAKHYGVDKATISKIVNPIQAERIAEQSKKSSITHRERMKNDRGLKDIRNKQMQTHRKYKNNLYKNGDITE